MPYYPKSQVKTNLYANFGEYLIASTGEPYQGSYWKNSRGFQENLHPFLY